MGEKIKDSGQAFLEYVLMIGFIAGLFMFFYRNLGNELNVSGTLIQAINGRFVYAYRHALDGNKVEDYPVNYTSPSHDSYVQEQGGTRFFGPAQKYPDQ